jgi:hypothetical protein
MLSRQIEHHNEGVPGNGYQNKASDGYPNHVRLSSAIYRFHPAVSRHRPFSRTDLVISGYPKPLWELPFSLSMLQFGLSVAIQWS